MSLYVFHNVLKSVQRLCGLGVETDVFAEIQFPCLFLLFDDDGLSGGLSYQTQYFGVSIFAIDDNLLVAVVLWTYSCLIFFCRRSTTGQVASMISILLRRAMS